MRQLHVLVPAGLDDPAQPSGGNGYDRRICQGLAAAGWRVHEHPVPGGWPVREPAADRTLAALLAGIPDGAPVLVDGLIGCAAPDLLVPVSRRLRLTVLVHMPLGGQRPDVRAGERAVLESAAAVLTTSRWTRQLLLARYRLPADRVHVAEPGVLLPDQPAAGTEAGGRLLCVAAVIPGKGHDLLLSALATLADLDWQCRCVGSVTRDPAFVARLGRQMADAGLTGRVCFAGPRTGPELAAEYAGADVLVLASRAETYGMVVTEALAAGLPVIATEVGGVPEALGRTPDGRLPGVLVPAADPAALAAALAGWLADADRRDALRQAARQRRSTLAGWSTTVNRVAGVIELTGQPARMPG